jgi:hypothetical protein
MLATVYFLMRALACDFPHEASKEFLIDYFEELRIKYLEFVNASQQLQQDKRKPQREEKKFLKFILCFFRIQGILYTKIGIDELEK